MTELLYPFIFVIESLYRFLATITHNFGISLILLSMVTSIFMFAFKTLFNRFPERERKIQAVLQPQIDEITRESTGMEKHRRISGLYQRYGYHPILALRAAIPILVQLPFLFAAWYVLNHYEAFRGVGFLGIRDLSRPDLLLTHSGILSFSISLLPLLMTAVNIGAAYLLPEFSKKSRRQAVFISLFLLILLYRSSSALLIYWTCNNIIFACSALYLRLKYNRSIHYDYRKALSIRHNIHKAWNFIRRNRVPELFRIYFSLLILYVAFLTLATGTSLVLNRRNLYVFGFVSALFLITSGIIKITNQTRGKTLAAFVYLSALITPLIAGLILKKYVFHEFMQFKYYLYATAWIYFIAGLISPKRNPVSAGNDTGRTSAVFVVSLFTLSPATYLARVNPDYLTGLFYPLYFAVFVVIAFIIWFFVRHIARGEFPNRTVSVMASLFAFLLVSLPIIRSYYRGNNTNFIDFALILLVTFFAAAPLKTRKQFNVVRIFGLSLFVVLFISLILIPVKTGDQSAEVISEKPLSISFSDSPNVYLLVYDGSPNQRTYHILDIDTERIKSIFNRYGFTWYTDTYSLGYDSLISMAGALNIANAGSFPRSRQRDIYAGNSRVNRVFHRNGYHTYKMLSNYLTGSIGEEARRLVKEYYPSKEEKASPHLDFFTALLRGIFQGELKFDTQGIAGKMTIEEIQARKRKLTLKSGEKKFVVNHINYPGHTGNSGVLYEQDRVWWLEKLEKSYDYMEEDFKNITKNDPDSIIIAIGDHGPFLTGDGAYLRHWRKEDITPDLIWDRIGTMIAIRWPDRQRASRFDRDLVLNQDIFPVVFSYLTNDSRYLSLKPDRTFRGFKIIFREGKLIK